MAKGDREILKADLDDGYAKFANLLLEALAMAKMSGVQKGICLFLVRRTYSWGQKEDLISLKEFADACDSSPTYVSKQLKKLIADNVVIRTEENSGRIPAYTINTKITLWNGGCLNRQGLSERTRQGLFVCSRQGLSKQTRVEDQSTLEAHGTKGAPKERFKESIKDDDNNAREALNIFKLIEKEFGRTLSPIETDKIISWEEKHSPEMIQEAVKRTILRGIYNLNYIDRILLDWEKSNIRTIHQVSDFEGKRKKRGKGPPGMFESSKKNFDDLYEL